MFERKVGEKINTHFVFNGLGLSGADFTVTEAVGSRLQVTEAVESRLHRN
jgi:hypothetical protein